MLTELEQQRFVDALPDEFQVEWDGSAYDYGTEVVWSGGDTSSDYPVIVLDWDVLSEPDEDRQPADGIERVENPLDDPEYTEVKTSKVYDDLSFTVAVESKHDQNGVPPQVRAKQITRRLWNFIEHEIDLNSEGPNEERPVLVKNQGGPTSSRVKQTYRLEWQIRFHHSENHEEVHETADTTEVAVDVE